MAPFVVEFKDIYHNYDLVCWVHSKKTPYSTFSLGDEWRKYLLDNILGSTEMVDKIINDFETTPDSGTCFLGSLSPVIPSIGWDSNYEAALKICKRLGIHITPDATPEYPSGTMFWFRPKASLPYLLIWG